MGPNLLPPFLPPSFSSFFPFFLPPLLSSFLFFSLFYPTLLSFLSPSLLPFSFFFLGGIYVAQAGLKFKLFILRFLGPGVPRLCQHTHQALHFSALGLEGCTRTAPSLPRTRSSPFSPPPASSLVLRIESQRAPEGWKWRRARQGRKQMTDTGLECDLAFLIPVRVGLVLCSNLDPGSRMPQDARGHTISGHGTSVVVRRDWVVQTLTLPNLPGPLRMSSFPWETAV